MTLPGIPALTLKSTTSDVNEDTYQHCTTGERKNGILFSVCVVLWAMKYPGRSVPPQHNMKLEINMLECNLLKAKSTVRMHYSNIIIYMQFRCNILDYFRYSLFVSSSAKAIIAFC